MISITGAAGKTGCAIIDALRARQVPVRAVVHRMARIKAILEHGATEVRIGDLTQTEALARAVAGSEVVYHICPNMRPDEVEIGERVIEVCKRVGVPRIVFHSVLHPQIEAMPHHWRKLRVEERLIESGLEFAILQPAAYMQNLAAQWTNVTERGVLEVPYAASTRLAMVDLQDVALVAAKVLIEDGHLGATYELCGSEVPSQSDVASSLAKVLGRTVEVRALDRSVWAERARAKGLEDYAIDSLVAMFEHYETFGSRGSPRVLEGLLGHQATTLAGVFDRWAGKAIRRSPEASPRPS